MQPIHATNMIVGKEYYIKSKSYPLSPPITPDDPPCLLYTSQSQRD